MKIIRIMMIIILFSTPSYAGDWGAASRGISDGINQGLQNVRQMQEIRMMEEQQRMLEQQRLLMEEQRRMLEQQRLMTEQEQRRDQQQSQRQLKYSDIKNCEEGCILMNKKHELKSGVSVADCIRVLCR